MTHEPVRPISEYCDALRTWMRCVEQAHAEDPEKFPWAEHLRDIELAIEKSSLLWRLIYGHQDHRLNKCPKHEGHWSGLPYNRNDCGCSLTGWVPNEYNADTAVTGWVWRHVSGKTDETWYFWKQDWCTRSDDTWPTREEAVAAWRAYMEETTDA